MQNNTNNSYYYYSFVNEVTRLEMQRVLYMNKIHSQLCLQAIEFYSKVCEQTRNLRQLTLTQVHKDTLDIMLGCNLTIICLDIISPETVQYLFKKE